LTGWQKHRRWLISQILLWAVIVAVLRVAVVPAESCPQGSRARVERAIAAGAAWLARGQQEDGRFLYGYYSETDRPSHDYNTTRHSGVLDVLYRVGRIRAADSGLAYALDNLIHSGRWTAFAPLGEDANVGTNALLVIALLHRRQATGERRYDRLLREVARFLVAQERTDGSVLQYWDPATRRAVPGAFGKFSTGEAFYALALMRRTFPGDGWGPPAHRVADYLATRRDAAEGYSSRLADHWAAYGLEALGPGLLTDTEAGYARWLAGYFGFLVRLESQHTGRILNPFAESGAELGTIGEATAALWRLTREDPRLSDLRGDLADRISCLGGILVDLQDPATDPDPRARGAWFADGYTQMDDQQHALAALIGASEVLRSEERR
jgi:hypothetical protein